MTEPQPTLQDIRADGRRRHWRWWSTLINIGAFLSLFLAIDRLSAGTLAPAARIWWIAVPASLLPVAYWLWARDARRQDELERTLEGRAAVVAFRLTLFWLLALALLNAAVGLPLTIPGPFGLPDDQFGWREAAFMPFFFWMFAWIRERRRLFPRA